jgi:two-component system, LytTR family, sensor kinase
LSANKLADEILQFADVTIIYNPNSNYFISYVVSLLMPFKFKQLLLYFILFNFIWSISLGANNGSFYSYFAAIFNNYTSFGLKITTTISFFLYALSGYYFLWYCTKRKKQAVAFFLILLCIPLVILFRYFLEEMICPVILGFQNYNPSTTLSYYLLDNKYFSIPYTAFGIVYYFLQSNRYKEVEKSELELQNREAELEYLKSQINPHFLFNNLNSIYSLVYHKSEKALKAIEQLSSLLRYMLYEKNIEVLVTEEVDYLKSFIELQKLRFDYEIPLVVNIDNKNSDKKIAPLLLIPLVENAFKHGDFKHPEFPLVIQLLNFNNELIFTTENKKGQYQKDKVNGIGITNLKRRLELIYPNRYLFDIEDNKKSYKATLKIKW